MRNSQNRIQGYKVMDKVLEYLRDKMNTLINYKELFAKCKIKADGKWKILKISSS